MNKKEQENEIIEVCLECQEQIFDRQRGYSDSLCPKCFDKHMEIDIYDKLFL